MDIKPKIPHYKPNNPLHFSDLQLAKRKRDVSAAERDYPHLPPAWIEMAWDLIESDPQNIEAKIAEWSRTEPKQRQFGGAVKCMEIVSPLAGE